MEVFLIMILVYAVMGFIIVKVYNSPKNKAKRQEIAKQQEIEHQRQLERDEKSKAEYMQIAKQIDEITKGIETDNGKHLLFATDESWNNLLQNHQTGHSVVYETKKIYNEILKTKSEFVKQVEKITPIDDKAPEQLNEGMQEIRDKMLSMYEYDDEAGISFFKALKKMVTYIERTQKLDDLLIKRGAEKSHVGFADEYFLFIAKESLEYWEKLEKEQKEQEEKELLYSQLNEIKQEQQQIRYMQQQMNKANQPKQSFLDNFFE